MSAEIDRHTASPGWIVAGITAFAASLRLFRLGKWNFAGDEINTLRDSIAGTGLTGPKPLIFFLNHHLVAPWMDLNEFGLRILPAVFGIAAVPAMYVLARRTVGTRAGLLAAVLVAVNPWHLYWSQFARYYSLVFLLSLTFPLALYVGFREGRAGWILTGVLTAGLALLAHPSSGLVLAGVGIWFAVTLGKRFVKGSLALGRVGLLMSLVVGLIALIIVYRLLPQLREWMAVNLNTGSGHAGLGLVLSYVDWVSLVQVCFAVAGLLWFFRFGNRALAAFILTVIGVPLAFLLAISPWVSVYTGYTFMTVPFVILCAALFVEQLFEYGSDPTRNRMVALTCLAVMIVASSPRIVSQYQEGGRLDFRAAAEYLSARIEDDDVVISVSPRHLQHYLPTTTVRRLPFHVGRLMAATQDAIQSGGSVWIVGVYQRRGGFNEATLGPVESWVQARCHLNASFSRPRLDFKHNEVRVFWCESVTADGPT